MTNTTDTPAEARENTDRELWRETPDDYYAASIHLTTAGTIGICVGGHVIAKPVRDWHALAIRATPPAIIDSVAEATEGACELCGREYRVWAAASPIWNAAIRGGSINGEERHNYLCADCFMGLAEDCGAASLFRVSAERTANLETVTPSGRVWDEQRFRWEDATRATPTVDDGRRDLALTNVANFADYARGKLPDHVADDLTIVLSLARAALAAAPLPDDRLRVAREALEECRVFFQHASAQNTRAILAVIDTALTTLGEPAQSGETK